MLNNITDIWAQHGEDYVNGYPEFANAEPPQLVDGYYQISTGFQLEWFANFVNANNTTANAKLLNDINLRGKEWVVIGTDSVRFNGIFDGQGHTISNFKITKTQAIWAYRRYQCRCGNQRPECQAGQDHHNRH